MTNAEVALQALYSNPPLPMMVFNEGDYRLSTSLNYFRLQKPAVDEKFQDPLALVPGNRIIDGTVAQGMAGWGATAQYDRAVSDHTTLFASVLFARLGPGRIEARTTDGFRAAYASKPALVGAANSIILQRAQSHGSQSVGIQLGINFGGGNSDRLHGSLFLGPVVHFTRASGTSLFLSQYSAADSTECPETLAGYKCISRDWTGSSVDYGGFFGIQGGIPLGKHFRLNPYLRADIMASFVSSAVNAVTDPDELLNGRELRYGKPINTLGGPVTEQQYLRALNPIHLGVNLTFRPWGLSANLTGSFIDAPLNSFFNGLSSYKILNLQLSKSFGRYIK
ncbi:MAG: hypothetical protein HY553_12940 [Elusimicrobia bacterium]|nr:hypothetical protein [Elusimicrobiota bacterium]